MPLLGIKQIGQIAGKGLKAIGNAAVSAPAKAIVKHPGATGAALLGTGIASDAAMKGMGGEGLAATARSYLPAAPVDKPPLPYHVSNPLAQGNHATLLESEAAKATAAEGAKALAAAKNKEDLLGAASYIGQLKDRLKGSPAPPAPAAPEPGLLDSLPQHLKDNWKAYAAGGVGAYGLHRYMNSGRDDEREDPRAMSPQYPMPYPQQMSMPSGGGGINLFKMSADEEAHIADLAKAAGLVGVVGKAALGGAKALGGKLLGAAKANPVTSTIGGAGGLGVTAGAAGAYNYATRDAPVAPTATTGPGASPDLPAPAAGPGMYDQVKGFGSRLVNHTSALGHLGIAYAQHNPWTAAAIAGGGVLGAYGLHRMMSDDDRDERKRASAYVAELKGEVARRMRAELPSHCGQGVMAIKVDSRPHGKEAAALDRLYSRLEQA